MDFERGRPVNYKIIEKDAFRVIGVKRELPLGEDASLRIAEFWNEVNENGTVELLFQLNNGQKKSVLGVCADSQSKQMMDYWIATEYRGEDVPEGLLTLEIPKSQWAVFEVNGPMPNAMQKTWKQIFSEWFPFSEYQHAGTPALEVYTDINTSNPNFYSEIWIPIKSKI